MKLIKPSYEILDCPNGGAILRKIESIGRVCYKSEEKIEPGSATKFVTGRIKAGHESILEHSSISVKFVCDRGVSHELVRHRIASFTQESTRYCNYTKRGLTFVIPSWLSLSPEVYLPAKELLQTAGAYTCSELSWLVSMAHAELAYQNLIDLGCRPEQARGVLPNSLKTEIVITANLREWRTIFKQRTAHSAHPDMRALMVPLRKELKEKVPVIFDDISITE